MSNWNWYIAVPLLIIGVPLAVFGLVTGFVCVSLLLNLLTPEKIRDDIRLKLWIAVVLELAIFFTTSLFPYGFIMCIISVPFLCWWMLSPRIARWYEKHPGVLSLFEISSVDDD